MCHSHPFYTSILHDFYISHSVEDFFVDFVSPLISLPTSFDRCEIVKMSLAMIWVDKVVVRFVVTPVKLKVTAFLILARLDFNFQMWCKIDASYM